MPWDDITGSGEAAPPRKTGIARLWEVFSRDYWKLMLSGLMALAACVPFAAVLSIAAGTHSLLLMAAAGLFGGMLGAPLLCGVADTVMRGLRDEPGFWWSRYVEGLRRNLKPSLIPGGLFGLALSAQIFTLAHLRASGGGVGLLLCQLLGFTVTTALLLFTSAQLVSMELSAGAMLKNSVLLTIRFFPRALLGALAQVGYWAAIALWFPPTLMVLLLTSLWFPLLTGIFLIYPALDEAFQLEKRLSEAAKNCER